MKVVTWNVNGIRACVKSGFLEWISKSGADFVCLQEIKADENSLDMFVRNPGQYSSFFNPAAKKGYAGTGIYYLKEPLSISTKLGFSQFDDGGRFIRFDYEDLILINLYMPNGGRDKSAFPFKFKSYEYLFEYLKLIQDKPVILVGDFNVAHTSLDLARPKENENNTMFTPEERKLVDELLNLGFADSLRLFKKDDGHYSWWSYGFNARERNLGWRIDYIFVSSALSKRVKDCSIHPEVTGSDHCPVILEI